MGYIVSVKPGSLWEISLLPVPSTTPRNARPRHLSHLLRDASHNFRIKRIFVLASIETLCSTLCSIYWLPLFATHLSGFRQRYVDRVSLSVSSHDRSSAEIAGIAINLSFEFAVVVLTWLKTIFIIRQMRHSVTRNQSSLFEVIFYNGEGSILDFTALLQPLIDPLLGTIHFTYVSWILYRGCIAPDQYYILSVILVVNVVSAGLCVRFSTI